MARKGKEIHHLPPPELELRNTLHEERHTLGGVNVPLVTISATYRQDIVKYFGEKVHELEDVVFSRAHFSMAIAVFEEAAKEGLSAWLVDPTNYVSASDWKKVLFIAKTGRLVARVWFLKKLKDLLDSFLRNEFPLRDAVTPPLLYAVGRVHHPIVSFHYEVGNILAKAGKEIIQVVTDPQVRPNYLYQAENGNIFFAVFDEETKRELIETGQAMGKGDLSDRTFVTGPPVDPRVVAARKNKKPDAWKKDGMNLAITTGGVGTNKGEIKEILGQIRDEVKQGKIKVVLYAGTNRDFALMFEDFALDINVKPGELGDRNARIRILYDQKIIEANKLLIDYAFSWAHGFVTKPSGDMAYDAVAAGCFVLSLNPWGEWEERVRDVFYKKAVLARADRKHFLKQLESLKNSGWFEQAISNALNIDELFLTGSKRIVELQQSLAKKVLDLWLFSSLK